MKTKSVLLIVLLFMIPLVIMSFKLTNPQKFYYAYDQKIYLNEVDNKISVGFREAKSDIKLESYVKEAKTEWKSDKTAFLVVDEFEKENLKETMCRQSNVQYCQPVYTLNTGLEMGLTDEIVVNFHKTTTKRQIQRLNEKYHTQIVMTCDIFQVIRIPKDGDVLEIANKIQESGLTEFCHPNFIIEPSYYQVNPNDTYYPYQYHLNNTGQAFNGHTGTPDADIDAPQAWPITQGNSSIIIAVIDAGVTNNHPDLPSTRQVRLAGSNFSGSGNANDPSPAWDQNHGNACAGIIAATMNNGLGIAGIAPNCKIMPIRIGSSVLSLANAINFARNNGAHIISISLGYPTPSDIILPVIRSAIVAATTQGRNNLGCIVACAAGNNADHLNANDGTVEFPANINVTGVLTVGASDRNDQQSVYSPSSSLIDLVAPSHRAFSYQIAGETWEMWTIDNLLDDGANPIKYQDGGTLPAVGERLPSEAAYSGRFGGTSCSAPEVAGVAALMLSVNANLTLSQVFSILTGTADKVGGYTYVGGRCNQMGYGRLNACRAVTQASATAAKINGDFLFCHGVNTTYTISGRPANCSMTWSVSSNLQIISQTSTSVTVRSLSGVSGSGSVNAQITSLCESFTVSKPIWLGTFEGTYVSGSAAVCPGSLYNYTAQVPGGHVSTYSYSWTYPSNWYNNGQTQNSIILQTPMSPVYGTVRVAITNKCGKSGYSGITVYPGYNCGGYYSMYPNPAVNAVTIKIGESTELLSEENQETKSINTKDRAIMSYTVKIFNNQGVLLVNTVRTGKEFSIPVNNLGDGNYIVELNDGRASYRQQLFIKRK